MRIIVRVSMCIFAAACVADAVFAFLEFDHIGDLRIAWGTNSLMASAAYLWLAGKVP